MEGSSFDSVSYSASVKEGIRASGRTQVTVNPGARGMFIPVRSGGQPIAAPTFVPTDWAVGSNFFASETDVWLGRARSAFETQVDMVTWSWSWTFQTPLLSNGHVSAKAGQVRSL